MLTRRKFLRSTAATGLTFAASGLAAPAIAQGAKIKLGYVSPQSGPLAGFAESDDYNIKAFLATEAGANFEVIVNDVSTIRRGQQVFERLQQVAMRFLELNLVLAGVVPHEPEAMMVTRRRETLMSAAPRSAATAAILEIATRFETLKVVPENSRSGFTVIEGNAGARRS